MAATFALLLHASPGVLAQGQTPAEPAAAVGADDGQTPADTAVGAWTINVQSLAYVTRNALVAGSVLNPGNAIAGLARQVGIADFRADLKYATPQLDLVARPRQIVQSRRGGVAGSTDGDFYLTQGYVRWRPSNYLTVTAGREVFSWGPANFRSPSNPFYFDAGRTNPLREVSGIDLARVSAADGTHVLTLAHVSRSGHDTTDNPYRHTTVLKLDQRTENALFGLVVAPQRDASTFAGGFAQITVGEPLLLYAEIGSQRRATQLVPSADLGAAPYTLRRPSARATVSLLGAAYTLENGYTLVAELLRDNHGYKRDDERAYFDRAALLGASPLLGTALAQAPRLLSRDYLYLHWQSNPNVSGSFWRASWTANLNDRSGQATFYGERNIGERWALLAQVSLNHGSVRSEYRSLLRGTFSLGAKLFIY